MVSPNSSYWFPYKKKKIWTETDKARQTQRDDGHMNMEAETWSYAAINQAMSEFTRSWKRQQRFLSYRLWRNVALPTP